MIVLLLELFGGDAGIQVVDADENAEEVGLEIKGVWLPAAGEGGNGIAADAAVQEDQMPSGEFFTVLGGDDELVAVAENVVGIAVAAPIAIRDGIALKQDSRSVKKGGEGIGGGLMGDAAGLKQQECGREQRPGEQGFCRVPEGGGEVAFHRIRCSRGGDGFNELINYHRRIIGHWPGRGLVFASRDPAPRR